MPSPVIQVRNLGKRYRISVREHVPRTPWQSLGEMLKAPFGYLRRTLRTASEEETLWAIRSLDFEVARGEVLGIIGRNGAGKSTLLKVLSRITDPTEGFALLNGRVGSLLEVGTGFHVDLTGRENIYMSGTILGMKKTEIDRKLDEIVEFADVHRFLDTPVKFYSSGMRVRLGFAVAAHLDPEILIVDEVLAVGDLTFQRKSTGKINQIARDGRTILFVSHSMPTIQAMCNRVLLLERGRITFEGPAASVVNKYEDEESLPGSGYVDLANHVNRITPKAIFQSLVLRNENDKETDRFRIGEKIVFELTFDLQETLIDDPYIGIRIERHGQVICFLTTHVMMKNPVRVGGRFTAKCEADLGFLSPGNYSISRLSLKKFSGGERIDQIENVASIEIYPVDIYGTGKVSLAEGIIIPKGQWSIANSSSPFLDDTQPVQMLQR